ncbi:MAG: hypothetical protein WCJ22_05785 [Actinomycetes bacterium]
MPLSITTGRLGATVGVGLGDAVSETVGVGVAVAETVGLEVTVGVGVEESVGVALGVVGVGLSVG